VAPPDSSEGKLQLPKLVPQERVFAHVPKRVYANAHAYHINSISVNSDGETFISADDLRINLWNLGISDQSFSIFFLFNFSSFPFPLSPFPLLFFLKKKGNERQSAFQTIKKAKSTKLNFFLRYCGYQTC